MCFEDHRYTPVMRLNLMVTAKWFNFFIRYLLKPYTLYIVLQLFWETSRTCGDTNANKDAKTIVDSKFDPKTIEKILLYKTQDECSAINQAVASINAGKSLVDSKYIPMQNTKPYDDLLFALVNDSLTVFSKYLGYYLEGKDETFIIMIFIQIDDRLGFIDVFNSQHPYTFDDGRKKQRKPFKGALRVWAEENRLPAYDGNCGNESCKQGQKLEDERSTWKKKCRDGLEYILMKKAFEDSRISIRCYEATHGNQQSLLNDIKSSIDNHDLVDLYTSLVRYVQNGDSYLAQVLHDYCEDAKNNWSMWIIILTTRRGDAMNPIDEAFRNQYNNITLKDYISKCNIPDPQFKHMLTILVDPTSASKRQKPPPPEPEPEFFDPGMFPPEPEIEPEFSDPALFPSQVDDTEFKPKE